MPITAVGRGLAKRYRGVCASATSYTSTGNWQRNIARFRSFQSPALALLNKKRRKESVEREELEWFVHRLLHTPPDTSEHLTWQAQASAFIMACSINGLSPEETFNLADLVCKSGNMLELGKEKPSVSLYSGIGDKSSLIVAPVCAACGVNVPKISDRGFMGGVVDKLGCIPGIRVNFEVDQVESLVEQVGVVIASQFPSMAPAERVLRQLRDTTGSHTVPLMTASIIAKSLACNADAFIFDVKTGSGDYVSDKDTAVDLAKNLVQVAGLAGKKATAFVTSMHQPLGYAIGSYFELVECLRFLQGHESPPNLRDIGALLSAQALLVSGKCSSLEEGLDLAIDAIESKRALEKFTEMVEAQGGDLSLLQSAISEKTSPYAVSRVLKVHYKSPLRLVVENKRDESLGGDGGRKQEASSEDANGTGSTSVFIESIDTYALAQLGVKLGAARHSVGEKIDFGSGILLNQLVGNKVDDGCLLCELYTNKEDLDEAALVQEAMSAFSFKSGTLTPQSLIVSFVDEKGVTFL